MTDRELLEAAAKAAGVDARWEPGSGEALALPPSHPSGNLYWNPLRDDGDALRLVVKLRIEIGFSGYRVWAVQPYKDVRVDETATMGYAIEDATRRAIVRAAAAMEGKT